MDSDERTIRVLLVDDHAVVRGGLRFFLSTVDEIEIIAEADDGERACLLCERYRPDVVLMDLIMPVMDGVEATRKIHERFPDTRVVALTSFQEGDLVRRALEAGAISYLLKDVPAHELVAAIRAAHAGRSTLALEVAQQIVRSVTKPPELGHDLTDRELEVLRLLGRGLTNAQISDCLVISRNTVRHHVRNILMKLEVTNRTEAAVLAMNHGLLSKE